MTVFYEPIFSKPEPDEEIEVTQRKLADVKVDTDAKTLTLLTVDGQILYTAPWEVWALILYTASWEVWALQMLVYDL